MDPLESWIDADAVKKMARELLEPPSREKTEASENAGYGPAFEGFAGDGEKPEKKQEADTEAVDSTADAPVVGSVDKPADPQAGATEPTREADELGEPWRRFRDGLVARPEVRGAFVLDQDGDPVFSEPEFVRFHFLAQSLDNARPAEGEKMSHVHVKVSGGTYLMVMGLSVSGIEPHVLGLLLSELLDAEAMKEIARQFDEIG